MTKGKLKFVIFVIYCKYTRPNFQFSKSQLFTKIVKKEKLRKYLQFESVFAEIIFIFGLIIIFENYGDLWDR